MKFQQSEMFIGLCLMIVGFVLVIALLAVDIGKEEPPRLIKTSRTGVFLYGVTLTACGGLIIQNAGKEKKMWTQHLSRQWIPDFNRNTTGFFLLVICY